MDTAPGNTPIVSSPVSCCELWYSRVAGFGACRENRLRLPEGLSAGAKTVCTLGELYRERMLELACRSWANWVAPFALRASINETAQVGVERVKSNTDGMVASLMIIVGVKVTTVTRDTRDIDKAHRLGKAKRMWKN